MNFIFFFSHTLGKTKSFVSASNQGLEEFFKVRILGWNAPTSKLHSSFDSPQFAWVWIGQLHKVKIEVLKKFGDPLWPFLWIIQIGNVEEFTDFDLILAVFRRNLQQNVKRNIDIY